MKKDTAKTKKQLIEELADLRQQLAALKAEQKQRENQIQLELAVQSAKLGLWDWNIQANTVDYSPEWARQLGYAQNELSDSFDELRSRLHPDDKDRMLTGLEAYLANPWPDFTAEARLRHKDGSYRWMLIQATLLVGASGRPYRLLGSNIDITGRKRVEEALQESEENFQKLLSSITEYVWSANIVGGQVVYRYYSPVVEKITGYPANHFMSGVEAWLNIIHPEDRPEIEDALEKEVAGEIVEHEYRIIRADREIRWLLGTTSPTLDKAGQVIRLDGVVSDITERKHAEEDLKKRNQFIETILDNLPIGLAVNYINEGTATYMNAKFEEIYGWPREKLADVQNFFKRVYPDPDYRKEILEQVLADIGTGDPQRMQWEGIEVTGQDGHKKIVSAKNIPVTEQNLMISTVQDITKSKQTQIALQESEARFRQIFENIGAGIALYEAVENGQDFTFKDINPAGARIGQKSRKAHIGKSVLEVYPGVREMGLFDVLQEVWRSGKAKRYATSRYKDERITLWVDNFVTKLPSGEIMAVYEDVTERKQADQDLKQSEARYRAIVEDQTDMICRWEPGKGTFSFVNQAYSRYYGKTADEIIGKAPALFSVPDEDKARVEAHYARLKQTTQPATIEHRVVLPGGEIRWQRWTDRPLFNNQGQLVEYQSVGQDITERKQAEETLRDTTTRLQAIIEASPAAIIVLDRAGCVTHWSPAAERIFGWQKAEVLGRPNPIVSPEKLEVYQSVLKQEIQGATFTNLEVKRQTKDGTLVDVSISSAPLYDPTKQVTGVLKIIVDITRRKRADESLRRYTERLESLHQIDRAILAAQMPAETAAAALERLVQLVPCRRADVSLLNSAGQLVESIATYNRGEISFPKGSDIPLSQTTLDPKLLRQEQPHQVEDYLEIDTVSPQMQNIVAQQGIRSSITNPLIAGGELIGLLSLSRKEPGLFAPEEAEMIREVADQLAIAIHQARLLEAERNQRQLTEALSEMARLLNRSLEVETVLDSILANAGRVVPHDAGDILLVNEAGAINIARQKGYEQHGQAEWAANKHFSLIDTPVLQKIAKSRKSQVVSDTHADPEWVIMPQTAWIRSYVCAPIFMANQLAGFISLSRITPGFYNATHAERLQAFAEQAGVALQNAHLYQQTQRHAEELEQRVSERTEELKEQYRLQAVQEERQRLARDLHDAVSQTLFSASLLAEAIPHLWDRRPEQARQSLSELYRLNRGALAEMRNLLLELRPDALAEIELTELLQQLVNALQGRTRLAATMDTKGDFTPPLEVRLAYYRIAQEAFNNISKYAQAGQVSVTLICRPEQVKLTIVDNGRGFDVHQQKAGHFGLQIMRERAAAIGAALTIASRPGQGTEIVVVWLNE